MKVRSQEKALQEGSFDFMNDLPKGMLGYTRTFHNQKIIVLLNFADHKQEILTKSSEYIRIIKKGMKSRERKMFKFF